MPQDKDQSINPIMAALVGAAVGAIAAHFMRKEARDNAVKHYKAFRSKTEKMLDDTQKKVDSTKEELKNWAEEMGEKAEQEAKKIDSKTRKVLAA